MSLQNGYLGKVCFRKKGEAVGMGVGNWYDYKFGQTFVCKVVNEYMMNICILMGNEKWQELGYIKLIMNN